MCAWSVVSVIPADCDVDADARAGGAAEGGWWSAAAIIWPWSGSRRRVCVCPSAQFDRFLLPISSRQIDE